MTLKDRYGNPLTTDSSKAADLYVEAIDAYLGGNIGDREALEAAVSEDDGFAMAHVTLARLQQFAGDAKGAKVSLAAARASAGGATPRERRHVEAIGAAIESPPDDALALVNEHLDEFPTDAFVLAQANGVYSLIGFSGRKDRNDEQIALLRRTESAYGDDWWFLSALAFAENESELHVDARAHAERSHELRSSNAHNAHTLAHIDYETGNPGDGATFLSTWRPGYGRDGILFTHLSWHHALFELTQGNVEAAVAIYESDVHPGTSNGSPLSIIADSASFLWRMMLAGGNGNLPWEGVSAYATKEFGKPGIMFADVHCAFAHAGAGDREAIETLIVGMEDRVAKGRTAGGEIVPTIARAARAFADADYGEVVNLLEPRMDDVIRIGGSHAQREVIEDTLIEASLRGGDYGRATALIEERIDRRPTPRDTGWLARARDLEATSVEA
jgi:hypothetical protein